MTRERFAVDVKWDKRKERYVARIKSLPSVVAYGATIAEAQENVDRALRERIRGVKT